MVGRWPSIGSSTLRSFRVSTALFTTTASADSSADLSAEISPGKVHEHFGLRAVRLYLMRLSVTLGFRASSHAHRPHPASLPVRVPTVVVLATAFFRAEFLAESALAFTTFAVTASGHLFLFHFFMTCSCPCRAHEGHRLRTSSGMSHFSAAKRRFLGARCRANRQEADSQD